jgi:hypothetical protein
MLLLPLAGAASGCVETVGPDPVYAEAAYVPSDITTYPHTLYQGQIVYLVNDHWYYRNGSRWVYYQREPDVLVQQRAYVQQAPRAHPRSLRFEARRAGPDEQGARPEERRARPEERGEPREGPPPGLRSPYPATEVR